MKIERNGKRFAIVLENADEMASLSDVLRYYTYSHFPASENEKFRIIRMLLQELDNEVVK